MHCAAKRLVCKGKTAVRPLWPGLTRRLMARNEKVVESRVVSRNGWRIGGELQQQEHALAAPYRTRFPPQKWLHSAALMHGPAARG